MCNVSLKVVKVRTLPILVDQIVVVFYQMGMKVYRRTLLNICSDDMKERKKSTTTRVNNGILVLLVIPLFFCLVG